MKLLIRMQTGPTRKPAAAKQQRAPEFAGEHPGMRIFMTTDTIGSVWTFTRELVEQYMQRGHSVVLMSLGPAPTETQRAWCEQMRRASPTQFHFEPCTSPLEWMDDNEHAYIAPAPTMLRIVETFKPHVMHTSQYCFGALPTLVPRVVTAHSDLLSWSAACRPRGIDPAPWLDRYLVMVQRGLDNADAVVAPTAWMLSALERNFRVSRPRSVIAQGRSLEPGNQPVFVQTYEPQAVTVGRLWEQEKNLALLTEARSAMPIVLARRRRYGVPYLMERHPSIRLSPPLSEAGLLNLFRESSVYVSPSLYEPFGLAALEAALCGCAVVANDLPSLREVWGDAATYFTSPAELEVILAKLNDDPAALAEARQQSHARALQLNATAMADSYLALYEKLIQRTAVPASAGNLQRAG